MKKSVRTQAGFFRIRLVLALLLCCCGAFLALVAAPVSSQDKQGGGPVVIRASGFSESMAVRDLPPAVAGSKSARREEEEENEINPQNRELIRHVDPNAPRTSDAALSSKQTLQRPNAVTPRALPTPSVSFEGMSSADTVALGQGYLPPDTNGAVGPTQYVQTVNVTFRVWDKAGNPLTNTATMGSLFATLGTPCANTNDGDPVVFYDQLADRWIISEFCISVANPNMHEIIAVSKTGDATGAYYLYDFMMPNSDFNDYPHFGLWGDAYYMTDNQFQGNTYLNVGVFAFDRAKMLAGDPTASFVYFDTHVLFPPGTGINGNGTGGMLPASVDGFVAPPVGAPCPFVYFQANEFEDPGDQLRIFDFHTDFTTPANSTFTERVGSPLPVAAFDPVTVPDARNAIPQPPPATSSTYLDAIQDRIMFRLAYRNFGSSEALVLNHTVNAATNPAYRAAVRWYELTRATPSSAFTVAEQQTFDGTAANTDNRWMGSIAMNFQGDIALGYSVSSTSVFPSIRYAAKLGTDPAGSGLAQGEQTIVAGGGSQTSNSSRWGDYSDMTVDPSDDCTFWYTQEYYSATSGGSWRTRIAKFTPGTQAVSPRGTISGTITNCSSGQPLPNAVVTVSGGFTRTTAVDGTFSMTVAPGTYSATITAPGATPVTQNNIVVTDGNTATVNACLTGPPIVSADDRAHHG